MELHWEDGFVIRTEIQPDVFVLSANREGLLSLANHLMALAEEVPGCHIHLDQYNSLEDGSADLILERTE